MTVATLPPRLQNLSAVAARYRGLILDLWGVLHDGVVAFPEALAALEDFRARGARVCLLSNSPRRARVVESRLAEFGITPSLYDYIITSGEMTFEALGDPGNGIHAKLGRHYLHIGPPALASLLEG